MVVPVAANAFATDSVEGQRVRPSGVMRFDLLKVVGSSPAFLARPDGESPARRRGGRGRSRSGRGSASDRIESRRREFCPIVGIIALSVQQLSATGAPACDLSQPRIPATAPPDNPTPALSLIAGSGLTATARLRGRDHGDSIAAPIGVTCRHHLQDLRERAVARGRARGAVPRRSPSICATASSIFSTAIRSRDRGASISPARRPDAGGGRRRGARRALKWEVSRGGDLFPHLYGALPLAAVLWARPLPLGRSAGHVFPELAP